MKWYSVGARRVYAGFCTGCKSRWVTVLAPDAGAFKPIGFIPAVAALISCLASW